MTAYLNYIINVTEDITTDSDIDLSRLLGVEDETSPIYIDFVKLLPRAGTSTLPGDPEPTDKLTVDLMVNSIQGFGVQGMSIQGTLGIQGIPGDPGIQGTQGLQGIVGDSSSIFPPGPGLSNYGVLNAFSVMGIPLNSQSPTSDLTYQQYYELINDIKLVFYSGLTANNYYIH